MSSAFFCKDFLYVGHQGKHSAENSGKRDDAEQNDQITVEIQSIQIYAEQVKDQRADAKENKRHQKLEQNLK